MKRDLSRNEEDMSERTLYMTHEDEKALIGWLLDRGAHLVPDVHYAHEGYQTCDSLEDVARFRSLTRNFFVTHHRFTRGSLELVRNESKEGQWFFIMPRHGGPAIDLLLAGEFREGNVEYVRPGDVGYYRTYWDPESQENKPAPKEQVSLYRELIQSLKQNYFALQTRHRVFCIGPGAREILRRGGRLVGLEDFSYGELDLRPLS